MNEEDDKYKEKWLLLASRCEAIQRENSDTARQVVRTRRNLSKARRLRMRLLQKLDELGDPWRHGQVKGISLKGQTQSIPGLPKSTSSSSSSTSKKSSASSPELDASFSLNVLPNVSNTGLSISDTASALVSSLANLPMPMLPMPVSPTPSPFDHDLLPNDSLTNSI